MIAPLQPVFTIRSPSSRSAASTVAPFTLLGPIVGIVTAWLVRGEHPTWGELLGSLVVLVGLGLALGARLGAGGERPAPYLRVDVKAPLRTSPRQHCRP